jgi:branched-chain amino acid transport system ATP-binding protein
VPLLEIEGLQVDYGRVRALTGVSLAIAQGEIVALIGANGAGKTTLLRAISGLVRPAAGTIVLSGEEIAGRKPDRIVRLGVAHAPEGRRVFARMSVAENLALGSYARRGRNDDTFERVLTIFPRLRERLAQRAGTLSGGEQQMLALGRALMSGPRLLLLDEPSLGLAPLVVQTIFGVIRDLNATGTTVLLVEQNARQALAIAARGYVLELGKVVHAGSARELLASAAVAAAYLGA